MVRLGRGCPFRPRRASRGGVMLWTIGYTIALALAVWALYRKR